MEDNMDYMDEGNNLVQDEMTQGDSSHNQAPEMSGIKIISSCGLYLSVMTLAIYAAQFVIAFIFKALFPNAMDSWFNIILNLIVIAGVGLPIFAKLMKKIPDSEIGEKKRLSFFKFIGFFIVCVAAAYISNIIGLFISAIIELIKGFKMSNPLEELLRGSNLMVFAIYAVIIAPVVEELIFRRILLNKLRRFGDLTAILLSGLAFGIFHFNLSQFFYASVIGFFFAYIVIRTNHLIYSIMLHMMMNLVGMVFVPVITNNQSLSGVGIILIWFYGAMTIGSILFILNIKKIVLIKPQERLLRRRDYILNTGVLLFLALGIGLIILNL